MEKVSEVKKEILKLIADNFGKPTQEAFANSYRDSTLPIITSGAFELLTNLVGREKASGELRNIFTNHGMKENYV